MKSQFLLAFNEICEEKNLPAETVLDALKTALVSAYRRDNSVGSSQKVTAEIDPRTGEMAIYAEKEVSESVIDNRTEVALEDARRMQPGVEIGDMIMADSTPRNFGRIAAQTAKQVILQRVREAERDHLFDEFSGREGEIVNGTVQSISGGNTTIGLGRTEAVLPRSQQVQGERYRPHDKIRVLILEVRRTNRGPQIFVSRSHRNLLRRLLELEVPEIYNGQVDIKSIAREAGARSKVAVQAMQPGVDPVGACVGMRGVRIQSIVRELNDEKIDVIEWDADPKNFIAKALSPAKVAHVFLDDDPREGRTATVIVPDDQLSLAIGREGQNARLAAKLTGWRIDIKSLTEAARDSLDLLGNPAADQSIARDVALHARVRDVIAKKDANRPITAEDYSYVSRLVTGVEGRVIAARAVRHDQVRRSQADARSRVPDAFWHLDMEELNLLFRAHRILEEAKYKTVGDVAYQFGLNPNAFLELEGFDEAALENVRKRLAELTNEYGGAPTRIDMTPPPITEEPDGVAALVDDLGLDMDELADVVAASQTLQEMEITVTTDDSEADADFLEALEIDPSLLEIDEALLAEMRAGEVDEDVTPLDDLSHSLVTVTKEPTPEPQPAAPKIRITRTGGKDDEVDEEEERRQKSKQLVFNEDAGRVVVKRKRKKNRRRDDWFEDED